MSTFPLGNTDEMGLAEPIDFKRPRDTTLGLAESLRRQIPRFQAPILASKGSLESRSSATLATLEELRQGSTARREQRPLATTDQTSDHYLQMALANQDFGQSFSRGMQGLQEGLASVVEQTEASKAEGAVASTPSSKSESQAPEVVSNPSDAEMTNADPTASEAELSIDSEVLKEMKSLERIFEMQLPATEKTPGSVYHEKKANKLLKESVSKSLGIISKFKVKQAIANNYLQLLKSI